MRLARVQIVPKPEVLYYNMAISRNLVKYTVAILLIFNGIGALYGGFHLIVHPDGSSIQLPLHYLQHSPFRNYSIPGIVLFVVNGVFSVFVIAAMLFNLKNYDLLVIAQGTILAAWIIIQLLMVRSTMYMHFVMGSVALLLLMCGVILRSNRKKAAMLTAQQLE